MDTDTQLMHRHYFEGPRGIRCRCGQTLDDLNSRIRALEAENERLRAVVKAARVLAQNYAVARDLDYHVRKVRDAVNELDTR